MVELDQRFGLGLGPGPGLLVGQGAGGDLQRHVPGGTEPIVGLKYVRLPTGAKGFLDQVLAPRLSGRWAIAP